MDTRYTPIFLSCSLLLASLPGWSQTYFAARSPEISAGQLDVLDLSTGISSQQIAVTISGQPIDGLTGMAHNYSTDLTYVLVKQDTSIRLAQIDLWTGVLSNAVTLPDKFASITFSTAGVLFGITGDGATVPESLYQIDPGTGNTTFVVSPGAGDDGEAIAFNTNEGLLYRYGGDQVFQKIDPTIPTVTDVGLEYPVADFAHAMVLDFTTTGRFFFTAGDTIYSLLTNGDLTVLSTDQQSNGDGWKGLVPITVASVDDQLPLVDLEAYPNPAVDHLVLQGIPAGSWMHEVFDASGRSVLRLRSVTDRLTIATTELPAGHYSIRSSNGNQRAVTSFAVR